MALVGRLNHYTILTYDDDACSKKAKENLLPFNDDYKDKEKENLSPLFKRKIILSIIRKT